MFNIEEIKNTLSGKFKLLTKKGKMIQKNFEDAKARRKKAFIDSVLEELEENHNHSWYDELYLRNKDNLDDVALFYRGTEVTYEEMFAKMREYAKSLKAMGVGKGNEIPMCMSNTPELVYLLGAISIIGAKANIFNSEFDKDYITEIIDGCDSEVAFIEDSYYEELKDSIDKSHVDRIVMTSLTDSLPKSGNPCALFDIKHGKFENGVPFFKSKNESIMDINEFTNAGREYDGEIFEKTGLDDEFTVTYSSGSTNSSRAKAIVHTTRSFITIGRCHDPEIQKSASMKDFTIQAHIPTHSNTDIISSISDSLMQGSKLALEPIYDKDFFLDSLLINRPTYVVATRSFWIHAMKKIMFDPEYKDVKMPFLLIPFSVGEPLDVGEEKFLNKGLRKVDAGKDRVPLPMSVVTMSIAGGDCEHGGIFWILFRALQSKRLSKLLRHEPCGLNPFEMVDVAVLDKDGKHCPPYKLGRLVANSPCNMKCYKNNPEATEKFFTRDADGKVYGDCNVYSYIDNLGGVHMKGRIPEKEDELPYFMIADEILRDTKNLMSCEVVADADAGYIIAHVEMQPGKNNVAQALLSAQKRCLKKFGEEICGSLVFRVHSFDEAFELTGCGKRNVNALREEGFTDRCVIPVETANGVTLENAADYDVNHKVYTKK